MTFYRDFAAAYGTIWLALMAFSIITQQHVRTGEFGLFGFPIISLAYAFFARHRRQPDEPDPTSAFGLFLKLNPAYKYLSLEDQAIAFAHWRNQHAKRHQADP